MTGLAQRLPAKAILERLAAELTRQQYDAWLLRTCQGWTYRAAGRGPVAEGRPCHPEPRLPVRRAVRAVPRRREPARGARRHGRADGWPGGERDALQRHANSGGVDAHLHQIDQEGSPAARAAAAEARNAHGVHHQAREEVAA